MHQLISATKTRLLNFSGNNDGLLRNLGNISWRFAEQGARIIVTMVSGILVARHLGPEQLGLLSYVQSYVLMFSVLATLGVDAVIVSELVKQKTEQIKIINTCFFLKLFGSGIALMAVLLSFLFLQQDAPTKLYIIFIACSLSFQSFGVIDLYFQSLRLNKYPVLANIISMCITNGTRIILVYQQAPLSAFVWVSLADFALLAIFMSLYYYRQTGRLVLPRLDKQVALTLIKRGWPQFFTAALWVFYTKIDQVMIKEMLSLSEVGYYSIANRFVDVFSIAGTTITGVLFPVLQSTKQHSEELYQKRLSLIFKLNFILFLVFALFLVSFSNILVVGLFGKAYQPAVILLIIMSGKLFFTHTGGVMHFFAVMEDLTHFHMYSVLFVSIACILLNYILLPKFGAIGAIITSYATQLLFFYSPALFNKRIRAVTILQAKSIVTFYKIKIV